MSEFAVHVLNRLGFGSRNGSGGGTRSVTNLLDRNGFSEWQPNGGTTMTSIGGGVFRVVFGNNGTGIQINPIQIASNDLVAPRIEIRRESGGQKVRLFDPTSINVEDVNLTISNNWQTYTWDGVKNVGSSASAGLMIAKLGSNGATQILVRGANLQLLTGQGSPKIGENVTQGTSYFNFTNGTQIDAATNIVTDAVGQPLLGDIDEFLNLGVTDDARLQAYVAQQLDWSSIDDSNLEARLNNPAFETLNRTLSQLWQEHWVNGNDTSRPILEGERGAFTRAVYSSRQVLEILADFWHNHFNVYGRDDYARRLWTSWDRDVIRPPTPSFPRMSGLEDGHLFGNFRQMLEVSSKHAAMLHYLDNYVNDKGSPNENYAREIMELHTLGAVNYAGPNPGVIPTVGDSLASFPFTVDPLFYDVKSKYEDADVFRAMRFLTGWWVADGRSGRPNNNAAWYFDSTTHDSQEKTLMGRIWPAFTGIQEVYEMLDLLAYHPGTAMHIALKLCQRFISDNPPQAIVDQIAEEFYLRRFDDDQLSEVVRILFTSDEFKDVSNVKSKLKRPFETICSAMRVCSANFTVRPDDSDSNSFMNVVPRTGQRPFDWRTPDGFPDVQSFWQGGSSLVHTWRAIDWLLDRNATSIDPRVPILQITLSASNSELASLTPDNITTFWLNRALSITPPGGWLGTNLHDSLVSFMQRRPDNDPSLWPSDFAIDADDLAANSFPHYWHERLRGMVKLVLSSPNFMFR